MISLSLKTLQPTTVRIGRVFVVGIGACVLAAAIYRTPAWLETWRASAVAAAILAAATLSLLAIGIAIRGSARVVERAALEIFFFGCCLVAGEAILLARSPQMWSNDSLVQRLIVRERAAVEQGIPYDGRRRSDVVRDLQAKGLDAVPGFVPALGSGPKVLAAIRDRGLLPLTNASNAYVVECNEGPGYLQFRTDEHGFNNPAGLVRDRVDVAVIGESFALGHCVAPSSSAVALIRERYPRTANFGVAGARVLSQLGVFREYAAPLEPPLVVWFVNFNFAEPREETSQPLLMKYLNDSSYTQHLRERQSEVDSFVREVLVPLNLQRDDALRQGLESSRRFPLERVLELGEVRRLVGFGAMMQRPSAPPDLSYFERAIASVAAEVRGWGGWLVVVVLPNYEVSAARPQSVAQYEAVRRALDDAAVHVVDAVAVFDEQPDEPGLYTLRTSNHPNERGHALIAEAVIAAVEREGIL